MADTKISAASRLTGTGIVKVPAALAANTTAFSLAHNLEAIIDPTVGDDSADGYSIGSLWLNKTSGVVFICRDVTAGAAVWIAMETGAPVGYTSGNWYHPVVAVTLSATSVGANIINFLPFWVRRRVTISELGVETSTGGGNADLAIYRGNMATGKPTGNALSSTGTLDASLGAVGVSGLLGASVTLDPGYLYYMAQNLSGAATTFHTNKTHGFHTLIGGTSLTAMTFSTEPQQGITVAQMFGTWPDLTAASFASGLIHNPLVAFKVA